VTRLAVAAKCQLCSNRSIAYNAAAAAAVHPYQQQPGAGSFMLGKSYTAAVVGRLDRQTDTRPLHCIDPAAYCASCVNNVTR